MILTPRLRKALPALLVTLLVFAEVFAAVSLAALHGQQIALFSALFFALQALFFIGTRDAYKSDPSVDPGRAIEESIIEESVIEEPSRLRRSHVYCAETDCECLVVSERESGFCPFCGGPRVSAWAIKPTAQA